MKSAKYKPLSQPSADVGATSRPSEEMLKDYARKMVEIAVGKSLSRTKDMLYVWGDASRACKRANIPFSEVICWRDPSGKTFLQTVVEKGDAFSVRLLHGCIPNGTYAEGKIVRTSNSLHKVANEEGLPYGYLARASDDLFSGYVGHFFEGQRHGWGRFDYRPGDFYEGYWKNGSKHGYGIDSYGSQRRKAYICEAIFEDGATREVIREKLPASQRVFFQRIKKLFLPR